MSNRKALIGIVGAMIIVGLVLLAIPFVKSLSVNPKQEHAAWRPCDVSHMQKGELKKCGWTFIYRRTDEDMAAVDRYRDLLADPQSRQSEQPVTAQNLWRSENREYFVFKPWSPARGCPVELRDSGHDYPWEPPEHRALQELPYFTEPCGGRTWDMSGRLYHRHGYPPERNLTVPRVDWVAPDKVLIYGG
jgi:ubiquinol-cytochrome c reductase iron-sulfur subunit